MQCPGAPQVEILPRPRRALPKAAMLAIMLFMTTDVVNNNIAPKGRRAASANGRADIALGVLEGHLGYLVRRMQVWVFQDFIRTLAPIDIRPAQYSVLVVIGANPGLSQSDLADTLGIERARLVRVLDHLQKRGLTQRLPSPRDRRSHALQLTGDGQKLLKRAKALAAKHEARLAEKLGPDQRLAMLDLLRDFAR
jgi:DNA-binding MarR family transcriptional regulator